MRELCASADLKDSGRAVRFTLRMYGADAPAFVIRHHGQVYAYLNECAHIPVELDQNPGQVFDLSGEYLVCSMHGAYYAPGSGLCLGGPCRSSGLVPIAVVEADGKVWLKEEEA